MILFTRKWVGIKDFHVDRNENEVTTKGGNGSDRPLGGYGPAY